MLKRRTLLWSGLGVAGALVVGWSGLPPRSRLGRADTLPEVAGEVGLNGWIKVAADGSVRLAMPYAEMGQGVHSALAAVVAEEMDLPAERVQLIQAPMESLYGNVATLVAQLPAHPRHTEPGHETLTVRLGEWMVRKVARELGMVITGGSSTVPDSFDVLRLAAATARAQLLGAASLQWKLPVDEFTVAEGQISHPGGARASYGELAARAAVTPPGEVRFKPRERWTLLGNPQPRRDTDAKSNGSALYGIDLRLPDMLYAAVVHAPTLGGSPGQVEVDAVLKRPGVQRVVRLGTQAGSGEALAVVARSSWHALQGAQALQVAWQPRPTPGLDSGRILQRLQDTAREAADAGRGFTFHDTGDGAATWPRAERKLEALYTAPYLAHATMEPQNCTAQFTAQGLEVWVPTQVPGMARAVAARVAGLPEARVTLHMTLLGGGFGRRLEVDVVAQAVRVAMECGGRPVKLLWSREQDFARDFYRPAAAALLRGALDADGRLQVLAITSAGDAVTPRWMERNMPALAGPVDLPDKTNADGLYNLPYAVAHQHMAHVATRSGVPVGNWRSVGHSHNAFFSEGFIDEMAHLAGQDPVAFRLALLADRPRHAAVLKAAADQAGWGSTLPPGLARGVALHESFGTIVAQVLEVSLEQQRPRVRRVVCAVDCGTVLNPDIVKQQIEGSVVFGLTAALYGKVDIVDDQVRVRNFPDQPLLQMRETPRIEVQLIASQAPPSGVGEPGVPPVAPALANALFKLTGQRLRSLPLVLA